MTSTTKITFLRQFPLFENLSDGETRLLAGMINFHKCPKYHFVYKPGDPSDVMYFLIRGVVKIGIYSGDQKEVIKSILHPIALFGELGITGEEHRQDFAIAMNEEIHYFTLKISDFKDLMKSNYQLSEKVLLFVGDRLRKAEARLEALVFKDARTRIIEFLKDAAERRGRQVGYETLVRHSLTQQDIANITGTSRQTVTSVLNELKKSNLIFFNRRSILIRDMEKLN